MKNILCNNGFVVVGNNFTQEMYIVILMKDKTVKECLIQNTFIDKPVDNLYAAMDGPGIETGIARKTNKVLDGSEDFLINLAKIGMTPIDVSFVSIVNGQIIIKAIKAIKPLKQEN